MEDAIYRLAYVSHNGIDGDDRALHGEIEQILNVSRANNQSAGITGALMFNNGCFAQVLEGPHGPIQDTFERIQCDMRHHDVVILAFDPVGERRFSRWSMAYRGTRTRAANQFAHFAMESGFDLANLDGDQMFSLLQSHMDEAEQQASI
ncbi:BLUF domain-containing protein [Salinisphaera sp.]|uniref:BLUF domain-containing protein n=1 Tax=Salinisphaera sp. TaxID=1914330 RepID=UPI002D790BFA|nr:BLUF domain-containing protein [Salinisphaera sp.]HET7314747.1 BLUF domain-containing protein [Salinisphaera sp.]